MDFGNISLVDMDNASLWLLHWREVSKLGCFFRLLSGLNVLITIDPLMRTLLFVIVGIIKCSLAVLHIFIVNITCQIFYLEDEHLGHLSFTQVVAMCSLQKTETRSGTMKISTYAFYCCNMHRDYLAKSNTSSYASCV
jgi:hypothetical protein